MFQRHCKFRFTNIIILLQPFIVRILQFIFDMTASHRNILSDGTIPYNIFNLEALN